MLQLMLRINSKAALDKWQDGFLAIDGLVQGGQWPGVFDLQMLNSGHLNKVHRTYNWNIASQTILLLEIHSTFTLAGLVAALDGPLRVW